MATSFRPGRSARRLAATLFLVTLTCALAAGVLWVRPAAAARYLHISVNKPGTVASGSTCVMRCRAKDQTGKAIAGVKVTFRWRLPEGTRTQWRTTNANGLARAARVTDCGATESFSAKVVVTATWRDQVRKVTRYFTIAPGGG